MSELIHYNAVAKAKHATFKAWPASISRLFGESKQVALPYKVTIVKTSEVSLCENQMDSHLTRFANSLPLIRQLSPLSIRRLVYRRQVYLSKDTLALVKVIDVCSITSGWKVCQFFHFFYKKKVIK